MLKSVIKEIIIMLLLCIAILLILGILFYDYIPTNKIVPTKEAYLTPENVKQEINEQITEIEKTEISYEITDSDLNIYKQTSSYRPGKADPFSLPSENTTEDTNSEVGNGMTENGTANEDDASDTDKNSTGTFFNDEGIK